MSSKFMDIVKFVVLLISALILSFYSASFISSTSNIMILFITVIIAAVLIPISLKRRWKYSTNISDKKFLILLLLTMLFGFFIGQFHFKPDVYVEPYALNISLGQDSAYVVETLTYHVSPAARGHEFYRSYYHNGPLAGMVVEGIKCPDGFAPKTYERKNRIELACRSSDYVRPGVYKVGFIYHIPRPYVCYQNLCFFDWNVLTNFQLDIYNARVHVTGGKEVWGYPPIDNRFDLPAKTLLEVKATKPRSEVTAYWLDKKEPDSRIFEKEWQTHIAAFTYRYSQIVALAALAVVLLVLYAIYLVFGKEVTVTGVPDVLHYPPTKRKPYDVNRIAFDDPNTVELEGIQATLLDLARKGWLEIGMYKIKFKQGKGELDEYEKGVYDFYKSLVNQGDTLDIRLLRDKINTSSDLSWLKNLKSRLDKLKRPKAKNAFDKKGKWIAVVWLLISLIIVYMFRFALNAWVRNGLLTSLWTGAWIVIILDTYCFGRFDKKLYKEILMWKAFARLLGDYSLIKKYAPQDILMWGDWLVYATALGKADNVIRAMSEFNVNIPNIDRTSIDTVSPIIIYSATTSRYSQLTSSKTSGFSGGGGFGGGFGGGGGGFR